MAEEPADTARTSYTVDRFFAGAPLEVIDMLRPSTRLDMIDYYVQADSALNAPDALGGSSHIVTLTPDYMKVAVSPVSTLELKMLPYKKENIVMSLYTVGGDSIAKDTRIDFYDLDFKQLPGEKFLKAPSAESFFNIKDSDISESDLNEWMSFQTVEYSTGPDDTPLTATLTTPVTLPAEIRGKLEKTLTPQKTAVWKSGYKFQ